MLNPIWNALIFFQQPTTNSCMHTPQKMASPFHHVITFITGWWFENMNFIFPYIGNHPPDWLSYFSEGQVHHQPVAIMLYLHYDTFDTVKNDVYIIYICIYMHWSYSSFFHHLISMSEASAGNQATTCSIHRWGPPGQPGIAGSKKWGTQRMSKVYSSIPWEFLYVFMICEQMYDNWHWGYVHEVVFLCLFSGTLCPSGS